MWHCVVIVLFCGRSSVVRTGADRSLALQVHLILSRNVFRFETCTAMCHPHQSSCLSNTVVDYLLPSSSTEFSIGRTVRHFPHQSIAMMVHHSSVGPYPMQCLCHGSLSQSSLRVRALPRQGPVDSGRSRSIDFQISSADSRRVAQQKPSRS